VPAGKVNDIAEAFALAEEVGLQPIVEIARAEGAPARTTRNPIRLSRTPARYDTAPPGLADGRDDGWPARNG
jgi:crotonobetainyl-CoA:carnitine CoA-transferase CaiB-like acyl-CoA transferase